MTAPRVCGREGCDEELQKRPAESKGQFATRLFCSRECSHAGRRRSSGKRRGTHCGRGHEFTDENTRIDSRGGRNCRACQRDRDAAAVKARGGRRRGPRQPRPKQTVQSIPPAPRAAADRPMWRPPGWSATPNIGRSA